MDAREEDDVGTEKTNGREGVCADRVGARLGAAAVVGRDAAAAAAETGATCTLVARELDGASC